MKTLKLIGRSPREAPPPDQAAAAPQDEPFANPFKASPRAAFSSTGAAVVAAALITTACLAAAGGFLLVSTPATTVEPARQAEAGPPIGDAARPPQELVQAASASDGEPPPEIAGAADPPAEPGPSAPDLPAEVGPAEEIGAAEPPASHPTPPRRDLALGEPAYAGVWGPSEAACSPRMNRRGLLPAVIDSDGAWAGDTSCAFSSGRRTGGGWTFAAMCSDGRKRWKTTVRLQVAGDRLVWTSRKGAQAYVRCSRTIREAARPGRPARL